MLKIKKSIILLSIIVLILLMFFIIYKNKEKKSQGVDEIGYAYEYEVENALKRVDVRNDYYIIKNSVIKFYTNYISAYNIEEGYKIIDEDVKNTMKQQEKICSQKMYYMLDKTYINENDITVDNILTKLGKINTVQVSITDMYVSERNEKIYIYFVYGYLRNERTGEISDFSVMVKRDLFNKTFSMFLQDYVEKYYGNIRIGDVLNINLNENIEENENNTYEYKHITDGEYVEDLFNQYKEEILYNKKLVYSKLDEEYRSKKFDSLEEFIEYNKNKILQNMGMTLSQYQKTKEDGKTRFVCIDQYGNNYIFTEDAIMNYSVILDTYTVDIEEFLESYYGVEDTKKVALNIQKIFDALNDKDYKYVYSKLGEGFKKEKFPTLDSFKEYAEENFYKNNEVEFLYYQKESEEYYSYTIKVLDKSTNRYKILRIIMKLKETTNFEFSFNVN